MRELTRDELVTSEPDEGDARGKRSTGSPRRAWPPASRPDSPPGPPSPRPSATS